ncbi:hypothetical protein LTR36_004850 [Oleoguttula mirabilis]|uniref:Uncharacterized protein n=1 Tax=Oleoguttula mirabilis TaxID=1507867 RepID=A0AAV9JFI0_9PEZI|nr:hypothetical protein LTR36_004850 [Oleoguttula mirabilis]
MPSFFDLPPELRNLIYARVVPSGIVYQEYYIETGENYQTPPPSITHVSHRHRQETLPIWRARNTFLLPNDLDNVDMWLLRIRGSGAEHLHRLRFTEEAYSHYLPSQNWDVTFTVTAKVTGSSFRVSIAWEGGAPPGPGQVSENIGHSERLVLAQMRGRVAFLASLVGRKIEEVEAS